MPPINHNKFINLHTAAVCFLYDLELIKNDKTHTRNLMVKDEQIFHSQIKEATIIIRSHQLVYKQMNKL